MGRFDGSDPGHRREPRDRPRDRPAHRRRGRPGRHHGPRAGGARRGGRGDSTGSPSARPPHPSIRSRAASSRSGWPARRMTPPTAPRCSSGSAASSDDSTSWSTTPASTRPTARPLEIDDSAVRKIIEVNVLGTLAWTRDAVAAGLAKSVVNIASIAGSHRIPGHRHVRGVEGRAHQPHGAAGARAGAAASE